MRIPKDMTDWIIRDNGLWAKRQHCKSRGYEYDSWRLYYHRKCKRCGDPFLAEKSSSDKNEKFGCFCSRSCAAGKGESHSRWRGGKQSYGGYVYIWEPSHPNANKRGYVAEHVLVISKKIGRPLIDKEQVHHINGVKNDNDPDNLVVMTINKHRSLHERIKRENKPS